MLWNSPSVCCENIGHYRELNKEGPWPIAEAYKVPEESQPENDVIN